MNDHIKLAISFLIASVPTIICCCLAALVIIFGYQWWALFFALLAILFTPEFKLSKSVEHKVDQKKIERTDPDG